MKLNDILEIENTICLDEDCILGNIPIWRIARFDFRTKLTGNSNKTNKNEFKFFQIVFNFFKSLFQLLALLINRKHFDNIIFPHSRLFKVDDLYVERLSDAVIEYSNIKKSFKIFERCQNGIHKKPRYNNDNIVYLDFISFSYMALSRIICFYVNHKYSKEINGLYIKLSAEFNLDASYKRLLNRSVARYVYHYFFYDIILKITAPKNVFIAPRGLDYASIIPLCKKSGVVVCEFQHGVTYGDTVLYSGSYSEICDPDYFLSFGKDNIGTQFGMPIDKVINIGWAYKRYLEKVSVITKYSKNTILVVSNPAITSKVFNVIKDLALAFPALLFHIRLHPQEAILDHGKIIENLDNVKVVDNTEESFVALSRYSVVIGENTSVIFEALSLGEKVGRLAYGGLSILENDKIKGGYIINSIADFKCFIDNDDLGYSCQSEIYSDFDPDVINDLLNI